MQPALPGAPRFTSPQPKSGSRGRSRSRSRRWGPRVTLETLVTLPSPRYSGHPCICTCTCALTRKCMMSLVRVAGNRVTRVSRVTTVTLPGGDSCPLGGRGLPDAPHGALPSRSSRARARGGRRPAHHDPPLGARSVFPSCRVDGSFRERSRSAPPAPPQRRVHHRPLLPEGVAVVAVELPERHGRGAVPAVALGHLGPARDQAPEGPAVKSASARSSWRVSAGSAWPAQTIAPLMRSLHPEKLPQGARPWRGRPART